MPWWGQILIVFGAVSLAFALIKLLLPFAVNAVLKSRLIPAAVYCLAVWVSTFFTDWATEHRQLVILGLCVVVGLIAMSWIISLVKFIQSKRAEKFFEEDAAWQIRQAREMGIPLTNIRFDENGALLHPETGEPIVYGDGVQFREI